MNDVSKYLGMLTVLLAAFGHWGKIKSGQEIDKSEVEKDPIYQFAHTWGYAGAFFSCLATIVFAIASQIQ